MINATGMKKTMRLEWYEIPLIKLLLEFLIQKTRNSQGIQKPQYLKIF